MKHVVALSGGKDSTAMALRLAEIEPRDYCYISTPVGNELPEFAAHLEYIEGLLGKPIQRLRAYPGDDQLVQVSVDNNAIPNFRMRFCTRILKIEPAVEYMKANSPCVQYVGLRADEPERDGIYGDIQGVEQRFPLKEWNWGLDEVLSYLDKRNVQMPRRTDCAWCFYQRLVEWWRLWREYPDVYQRAVEYEELLGATLRSPGRDTWPAALVDLRAEFEKGRRPRGASDVLQGSLFDTCDLDEMCRVCSL